MSQSTASRNFYALLHLLQDSGRRKHRSPAQAAAMGVVESEIIPILATAFDVHRELDTDEILELCKPAIAEVLRHVMKR